MKGTLTLLIRTVAFACIVFISGGAFSQIDDYASAKKNKIVPRDNMPVIIPESHDSIPVIYPNTNDHIPTVNPDTASGIVPNSIVNPKKKKTYRNNYEYPSYGNHFGNNRIGNLVGQSDTRRRRRKQDDLQ